MKYRNALIIIFIIILADQSLKFFIKTNFINGDQVKMLGNWFKLCYIENDGMAYGLKFGFAGAAIGKILLTSFRLVAVVFGFFYLNHIVKQKYNKGLIICGSMILAGAMGNLIDSLFYGLIFSNSSDSFYSCSAGRYESIKSMVSLHNHESVAHLTSFGHGYGKFMQGRVVDMLSFPIIDIEKLPAGIPFFGGKPFVFFEPIFNIADASISVGVIMLMILLYFVGDLGKHK